jgi:hypothetical protein
MYQVLADLILSVDAAFISRHMNILSYERWVLNSDQTTELSELFRLLGEPNRLAIVISCLDGPLCVGEITARLTLSLSLRPTICACCAPPGCSRCVSACKFGSDSNLLHFGGTMHSISGGHRCHGQRNNACSLRADNRAYRT